MGAAFSGISKRLNPGGGGCRRVNVSQVKSPVNHVFPRGTLLRGSSFSLSEPPSVSDHEEILCSNLNQMLNVANRSFNEVTTDWTKVLHLYVGITIILKFMR